VPHAGLDLDERLRLGVLPAEYPQSICGETSEGLPAWPPDHVVVEAFRIVRLHRPDFGVYAIEGLAVRLGKISVPEGDQASVVEIVEKVAGDATVSVGADQLVGRRCQRGERIAKERLPEGSLIHQKPHP
jgi:hypothetical protein